MVSPVSRVLLWYILINVLLGGLTAVKDVIGHFNSRHGYCTFREYHGKVDARGKLEPHHAERTAEVVCKKNKITLSCKYYADPHRCSVYPGEAWKLYRNVAKYAESKNCPERVSKSPCKEITWKRYFKL